MFLSHLMAQTGTLIAISVPSTKLCNAQQMSQEISGRNWLKTKPRIKDIYVSEIRAPTQEATIRCHAKN